MRVRALHEVFNEIEDLLIILDVEKNKEAFAELVQVLDDRSLSLILRESQNDGEKPWDFEEPLSPHRQ